MLKGIRVLQFEGLAPSVFCGMYFADQGAQVILIARKDPAPFSMPIQTNLMNRGKKCIVLSPKIEEDKLIIQSLMKISDVVIDPYRPGVLEKLGLGPEFLFKVNKKAVLLRVSGYGQSGPMSQRPGHDLNYISSSGIVPKINKGNSNKILQFPTNFLADFGSCSLGITATLAALTISKATGLGRIVDCSMTDGCTYYTKIINQHEKTATQNKKTDRVKFIKEGNFQYCILYKQQCQVNQISKIVKQMAMNNNEHFKTASFSISKIKQLPSLESSIDGLKNPFSMGKTEKKLFLPRRNQQEKEIKELALQTRAIKPKL